MDVQRRQLEAWVRAPTSQYRMVERARMILTADGGVSNRGIAVMQGARAGNVSRWLVRFAQKRLAELQGLARAGGLSRYDQATERRILAQLDQLPPGPRCLGRKIGGQGAGGCFAYQAWRVLRRYGIHLRRRRRKHVVSPAKGRLSVTGLLDEYMTLTDGAHGSLIPTHLYLVG